MTGQLGGQSGGQSGGESGGESGGQSGGQSGGSTLPLIPVELMGWIDLFKPEGTPKIGGAKFPAGGWDPLVKANAITAAFASNLAWVTECDPGAPNDSDERLKRQRASRSTAFQGL